MSFAQRLAAPPVGRVYTPAAVARAMLRNCLESWRRGNAALPQFGPIDPDRLPRVLDPACGDGVFVQEAFAQLANLCQRPLSSAQRLKLVERCLAGVDRDAAAVSAVRRRMRAAIVRGAAGQPAPPGSARVEQPPGTLAGKRDWQAAARVVRRNFLIGDALTGCDFGTGDRTNKPPVEGHKPPADADPPIHWAASFPDVAREGGFDVVIGNPPYVRERDAKRLLDRVAASRLGRTWRQPRMDYWHYFVHRGLDLLKPGGLLCFVVSSYWLASRGARRLIERLHRETEFEEFELLGKTPIFGGVGGWHMIFRLRKRQLAQSAGAKLVRVVVAQPPFAGPAPTRLIAQADLVRGGRIVIDSGQTASPMHWARHRLQDQFETRQGIAENPPRISPRLNRKQAGRFTPGEGVFVLRAAELERLEFSDDECRLLRPYYQTASLGRYHLPEAPTHWLLYLTRQTAATLENYPNVARHLARFRAILDARRETMLGRRAWWHLHWPREERLFTRPRILAVQMGRTPRFVFTLRPAFVGFSVNLVLDPRDDPVALAALCGLLNSRAAARWFECHAKRRGVGLEINAHVLREFPLPARDLRHQRELAALVDLRHRQQGTAAEATDALIDARAEELLKGA